MTGTDPPDPPSSRWLALPLLVLAGVAAAFLAVPRAAPSELLPLPDPNVINYPGTRLEWPNPDFEPTGGYPRTTFEARRSRMMALTEDGALPLPDPSKVNWQGRRPAAPRSRCISPHQRTTGQPRARLIIIP
jgi:hypothetical protein